MKIIGNRIRAGRRWVAIAVGVLLLALGVAIWLATRPPGYATYTLRLGDAQHSTLRFTYPADWEVTPIHYQHPDLQAANIQPRASTGLRAWLERHGFRTLSSDWQSSKVFIVVFPRPTVVDLDGEVRRTEKGFMLDAWPLSFHPQRAPAHLVVRRSTCEAGPLLEYEFPWVRPGFSDRRLKIYAAAQPGAPTYGVEIECESRNTFKGATYQVADQIVGSLRVVTNSTISRGEARR